jgi:hypothetical protein
MARELSAVESFAFALVALGLFVASFSLRGPTIIETTVSESLWENVSGVATYDGFVNVTGNITAGGYSTQSPFKVYAPNGAGNLEQIVEFNTTHYKFVSGLTIELAKVSISVLEISLPSGSRNITVVNNDWLVQYNYPFGAAGNSVQNLASDENATAFLSATNGFNRGTLLGKFSPNDASYPDGALWANNQGKLLISSTDNNNGSECNSTTNGIDIGFNQDFLRGDDLSPLGLINFTPSISFTPNETCHWKESHFNETVTINGTLNVKTNVTSPKFCFDQDNCIDLKHMVKLKKTVNQSIPVSSSWTTLNFTVEDFDVGDMFNSAVSKTNVTINKDRFYSLTYHLKSDSSDKASYEARILRNGVEIDSSCSIIVGSKDAGLIILQNSYNRVELNQSDVLILQVKHDKDIPQLIHQSNTYFQVVQEY